MPPIVRTAFVAMIGLCVCHVATAQTGTVLQCSPVPPLISIAPLTPDSQHPVTIKVLIDDGQNANGVIVSSVAAVVHGTTIDTTLVGTTWGPAPPSLPICGSIPLVALRAGSYVVNYYFLSTNVGSVPFLQGSSNFTVTDAPSQVIPTLGWPAMTLLMLMVALGGLIAVARVRR